MTLRRKNGARASYQLLGKRPLRIVWAQGKLHMVRNLVRLSEFHRFGLPDHGGVLVVVAPETTSWVKRLENAE